MIVSHRGGTFGRHARLRARVPARAGAWSESSRWHCALYGQRRRDTMNVVHHEHDKTTAPRLARRALRTRHRRGERSRARSRRDRASGNDLRSSMSTGIHLTAKHGAPREAVERAVQSLIDGAFNGEEGGGSLAFWRAPEPRTTTCSVLARPWPHLLSERAEHLPNVVRGSYTGKCSARVGPRA